MGKHLPDPADWKPPVDGMGTCFHRALTRWTHMQIEDSTHGWRVAVGLVNPPTPGSKMEEAVRAVGGTISQGVRHVHCWMERGDEVISAVSGKFYERDFFYLIVNVERDSVRLVNPRKIIRKHGITRDAVEALLEAWGGKYHLDESTLGVVAD